MWHEARRVEKQLRGMMVNFKRRAERRRAFYQRMKQDPVQLLRVYGTKSKIHIDAQVATAAENPCIMMPWQGRADCMIDRFDARANLDIIPPEPVNPTSGPLMETDPEQNRLNYERYRTLVMIEHSGVSEEEYLQQLAAEELIPKKDPMKITNIKKEKRPAKASIGYSYDDSSAAIAEPVGDDGDESEDSDADSVLSDIDVTVDVDELTKHEMQEIDNVAMNYGMAPAQYCRKLKVDKVEAEEQKRMKQEEDERALMGGRRSRKDRRSARDRQRNYRIKDSPPSFARRSSPTYDPYRSDSSSSSSSCSASPENSGQVEFITEFGANDDDNKPSHSSLSRSGQNEHKDKARKRDRTKRRRSRSRERKKSRERSRSRSRDKRRERSSSRDRHRSRARSRSSSRDRRRYRSRSRSSSREREREGDRYDRYRDSKESIRAKDTAKATAKLTGLGKDKDKKSNTPKDKTKLTPQERMKRKMQLMLNKQLKVDRKEERVKRDAKEQERMDREDDLKEMQRKWRDRRSPSPRRWRRSRSRSPDRSVRQGEGETFKPVSVLNVKDEPLDEEAIRYIMK